VAQTAAAVFPHTAVWFIPQEGADGSFGSFIILASESPFPERDLGNAARRTAGDEPWTTTVRTLAWPDTEGGTVLTDQFNPVAAWNAPVDLAIRRQVLQYIPWEVLTG